jgi:hypothetical protein
VQDLPKLANQRFFRYISGVWHADVGENEWPEKQAALVLRAGSVCSRKVRIVFDCEKNL